ncbi:hypothetical protein TNCV_3633401 [Trichonephila clavipes]|nr:hypothetical protein TNCV_3633401 [Trichonephila clavipes]
MLGMKSLDWRKTPRNCLEGETQGTTKRRGEERKQCDQGRSVNKLQKKKKKKRLGNKKKKTNKKLKKMDNSIEWSPKRVAKVKTRK